jgi:pimeloyl-ACP methyl ester carboxylesterase
LVGFGFALAGLLLCIAAFTAWQTKRIETRFPPRGRFVAVPGGVLHILMAAPTSKTATSRRPTVLLLHGASANAADLMSVLGPRLVSAGYQVLAPDRPGHGWSDRPGGRKDALPAQQAVLIRQGLAQLGVERAIVVGFSWSGSLACNFALDHPEFTRGLVLLCPVTHPWPGGITWYYRPAAAPVVGTLFAWLVAMPVGLATFATSLKSVFAPMLPPHDYVPAAGALLVLRPKEFTANAQDVAGLKEFVTAQAPRLSAIKQPTAIIAGDRDSIVWTNLHSKSAARDIPAAYLAIIGGAGHQIHYADPAVVTAAIIDVAQRSQ